MSKTSKKIITSEEKMIDILNNAFPGCNAVSTEEWDGRSGGIWFRGTESCEVDDMPFYDGLAQHFWNTFGVNPAVEKLLNYHGWYAEAYDSGTLMAYKI